MKEYIKSLADVLRQASAARIAKAQEYINKENTSAADMNMLVSMLLYDLGNGIEKAMAGQPKATPAASGTIVTPQTDDARGQALQYIHDKLEDRPFNQHGRNDGNRKFIHRVCAIHAVNTVADRMAAMEQELRRLRANAD